MAVGLDERISTRAPREGSDILVLFAIHSTTISTRAPREGSDVRSHQCQLFEVVFLPARPARGATRCCSAIEADWNISTRAPREGSDAGGHSGISVGQNFYPRSPRGERPFPSAPLLWGDIFLPALPARGATFSTAKSRAGSIDFYPRSPRGERPYKSIWWNG